MFLDGDLIATGTMRGDRLVAGTEITAPLITGGQMVAGSVVSSGTPPAFELQQDGTLYARRANISGTVNASSGRLNNVIIDDDCQILGKLTAMQIVGDIVKIYPCPTNNGFITIEPEPFDRMYQIMAVTLSAQPYYGNLPPDTGGQPIRWNFGLLEIFIKNENTGYERYPKIETTRLRPIVTESYFGDILAGEKFYISTNIPKIEKSYGIPDFITIMVIKK